mmetsp:Transcript_50139/g.80045  ORF Transcript_50139/g.80045 Transcript_50139/m.80045 type:complete len:200 (+) Transcript_50139:66-665(+)
MDFAALWQDGSGSCSMTGGSCSSTGSTKSTCRADAEYTIDIEKEVDKLIEDPSRPSRPRRKRRDGGSQTLSFLHPMGDKGNVSAGLAAYRAKGLATLQAMEMHDRPRTEPRESTHDAGLFAYRAHGLATLQAMEASGNGQMWPTSQVYTSPGWYGQSEAPTFYAADWMPPPGTVLVPAGMAQAPWTGQRMYEVGNGMQR